ncbi:MAG: ScpA family protein [Pseudomonadales bacterium]|nr:ScpA family protein [Pseudomonadales bacterium]
MPSRVLPERQSELPLALVDGKPFTKMPGDLYIPPDALEVFLEAFEGPLDLLLYLIKRQNLDILNIQVADITGQYMQYIDLMKDLQFELAAEYLVMAAMLAEIKSRMLLPRQTEQEEDESDPRAELIRRLQEYERFKSAAIAVDELPRSNRDFWIAKADTPASEKQKPLPEVQLQEMLVVLAGVLKRSDSYASLHVRLEPLSTRERMLQILQRLQNKGDSFMSFISLFDSEEGRSGLIVTFIATLELIKESLIEVVQTEPFAPVHVRVAVASIQQDEIERP